MSIPIFSVSQSFPEAADPILCSLLEDDYFLSKVLEHLVDDESPRMPPSVSEMAQHLWESAFKAVSLWTREIGSYI